MSQNTIPPITTAEFKLLIKECLLEMGIHLPYQDQDRIFNIKEAAAFVKLAVNTLYEKTSKGLIPFFKRDKKLYFRKSDLEGWLMERSHAELDHTECKGENKTESSLPVPKQLKKILRT